MNKTKRTLSRKSKRLIFFICILALPLIQFAIFYLYVNFNSIILAFQNYAQKDGDIGYNVTFAGFNNFVEVFKILQDKPQLLENSLTLFIAELFIAIPLALCFSYYIYKQRLLSGIFRVLLFLPQIISGTVFAIITKIFLTEAVPLAFDMPYAPLLDAPIEQTRFILIAFTIFCSFGTNVLLFTGAMTNISPSLVEASELDGCNPIQEFIHVTIPCIFPTVTTFIIMLISGIFVNQMHLMTFNLGHDMADTIGFYIYKQAQAGSGGLVPSDVKTPSFSVLSAASLLITIILFPLTLGIRKLLTKFGPSAK